MNNNFIIKDIYLNKQNNGFNPDIVQFLYNLPEEILNNKYYKLHHPYVIYNNKLRDFCKAYTDIVYDVLVCDTEQIMNKHINVLSKFVSFYECLYEIFICFCDKHKRGGKEFNHEFLRRNKYKIGEEFNQETHIQIEYFRELYNKIRHSDNIIGNFILHGEQSNLLGYSIFYASDDDSYTPNPLFHPKFFGMQTGNSFNRDLKIMLYCVYYFSDLAFNLIKKNFDNKIRQNQIINSNNNDSLLKECYILSQNLGDIYLINEIGKYVPDFSSLTTIKSNRCLKHNNRAKITQIYSGDGYTRKYSLLYMN